MLPEQVISLIDTADVIAIIDVIIMIYTKYVRFTTLFKSFAKHF